MTPIVRALTPRRASSRVGLVLVAGLALAGPGVVVAAPPPHTLAPDQVGAGELLWQSDDGLVPLPIVDLAVDLEVTGVMLRGRVVQTFENTTAETIEVVYAFPLPARAAVHRMEIRIGDRRIVATVQEKHRAQQTYEAARAEGRRAALVDQDFGSLFTTKAANIDPGETIAVVLEYLEEVAWVDGAFELRFPLTYVPRFTPPPAGPLPQRRAGGGPDATSTATAIAARHPAGPARDARGVTPDAPGPGASGVPSATVHVALDAGVPLAAITSASHAIDAAVEGSRGRVATIPGRVLADRDFLLRWTPERSAEPTVRVMVEDRPDGRYGLVMLLPPGAAGAVGRGLPTETIFVIDVSGSMDGPPLAQAREALVAALDRLRPEDRFNVVKFSDHHASFAPGFVQAEGADLAAARDWVRGLHTEGGTMILPALVHAMELLGRSRSAHGQRVVFLTDGAVANEPEVLDAVANGLGDARLHTIGIGHAPNTWLMRKMARHGRGLCTFISNVTGARNGIDAFLARVERPVLADVTVDWEGAVPADVLPARIPDLYAGEPLHLSFRLAGDALPSRVRVGGYSRAGRLERTAPVVAEVAPGAGLGVRWARARVETLMDSLHEGADPEFVRGEVVDVGLAFDLVTLYTSLVAVDHGQDDTELAADRRAAALLPRGGTTDRLRGLIGAALVLAGLLLLPRIVARPS